CARDETYFDYW
nr:immunoglobulin heavy chain junction region [Mus musculus]